MVIKHRFKAFIVLPARIMIVRLLRYTNHVTFSNFATLKSSEIYRRHSRSKPSCPCDQCAAMHRYLSRFSPVRIPILHNLVKPRPELVPRLSLHHGDVAQRASSIPQAFRT